MRQWLALGLLVCGVVSGVLCTQATLGGIKEEKVVVQLAQDLVVHEAVVAEATRVQQKARETAVAVKAVESAQQQLSKVQDTAHNTLGALQAAAAALDSISNTTHTPEGIFNIQVGSLMDGGCPGTAQTAGAHLCLPAVFVFSKPSDVLTPHVAWYSDAEGLMHCCSAHMSARDRT
jgi:hypothetical protein